MPSVCLKMTNCTISKLRCCLSWNLGNVFVCAFIHDFTTVTIFTPRDPRNMTRDKLDEILTRAQIINQTAPRTEAKRLDWFSQERPVALFRYVRISHSPLLVLSRGTHLTEILYLHNVYLERTGPPLAFLMLKPLCVFVQASECYCNSYIYFSGLWQGEAVF